MTGKDFVYKQLSWWAVCLSSVTCFFLTLPTHTCFMRGEEERRKSVYFFKNLLFDIWERGREREGGGERGRERKGMHPYLVAHVFARAPSLLFTCLLPSKDVLLGKGRQWWGRERRRACRKEKEKAKLSSSFTNLAHISSILSILCACVGLHC